MRISDWSSDVCSSDLLRRLSAWLEATPDGISVELPELAQELGLGANVGRSSAVIRTRARLLRFQAAAPAGDVLAVRRFPAPLPYRLAAQLPPRLDAAHRTEEHTSELTSLMRHQY